MIESCYWKEELWRIARTLVRVAKPPRWSERAHCIVERDVMIGFFMLRRMIELKKVARAVVARSINVYSCKSRGKPVTQKNGSDLYEMYDMDNEKSEAKAPMYLSNQFVHAYTSHIYRDESRNWTDIFIVSDFDRNTCIWRIPVEEIRLLFTDASKSYPTEASFKFDKAKRDYVITTD